LIPRQFRGKVPILMNYCRKRLLVGLMAEMWSPEIVTH
jgi:hypothetical protein